MKNITIVGAGLAGSLLSVYLAKKNYSVNVYERRPDMRLSQSDAGKSINLALSTRGIYALKEVGIYDEIKKISIPMYGRMIHSVSNELMFQRYGKDDSEYINAVSRGELNRKLMNLAEKYPNVKIHFNQRCTDTDFINSEISFHDEITQEVSTVNPDAVIAADGATSAVRLEMMKIPRFNFSQEYENYGYKELIIPAGENGSFRMDKNALHIWPRGSFMLIALPNLDGSYTCTLFMAYDYSLGGKNSFEYIDTEDKLIEFFRSTFSDAFEMIPDLVDEYFTNPTGTLMTVKCYPWKAGKNTVLLGDSCHAIVPFFGQGMNAAFEDCVYLNECIGKYGADWDSVFSEFQILRKDNSDAIADLARENFVEMRDLVADRNFQLKKKIESELYKIYPDTFIPKYTMVTFMRIPYSLALGRGRIQEEILNELSDGISDVKDLDLKKADSLINMKLRKLELIT